MKADYRVGIVGAGMITEHYHLPAILNTQKIKLVALVDEVPERAYNLSKKYCIKPKILTDVNDIDGI